LYKLFDVGTFSALPGVVEIAVAVLVAIKPLAPKLSVVGSIGAIGLFLGTISFLFTTPGIGDASADGFPVLSSTGQFLIKDVAHMGLSACTLADSVRAVRRSASQQVVTENRKRIAPESRPTPLNGFGENTRYPVSTGVDLSGLNSREYLA